MILLTFFCEVNCWRISKRLQAKWKYVSPKEWSCCFCTMILILSILYQNTRTLFQGILKFHPVMHWHISSACRCVMVTRTDNPYRGTIPQIQRRRLNKTKAKLHMLLNLTHWGRDKMAAVLQTALSYAFSWVKMSEFRLRFHWSLFLRV